MNQKNILTFCRKAINFGFYSLAFFSPLSISATQIALSIILLSWIVLMISEKRVIFAKNPLNYPIFAYVCAVIIASLFGVNFIHSLKLINKLWITLTFFAMLTFIEDMRILRRLIHILLIVTSIASLYGVLQHLFPGLDITRPEGRKVIQWTVEGGIASTGFFDHHMTYGGFLLLVFSLSFSLSVVSLTTKLLPQEMGFDNKGLLSGESSQISSIFYIPLTTLILGGLISSMTRNAWFGSLCAASLIIILSTVHILFRSKRLIGYSGAGFILLCATAYSLFTFIFPLQNPLIMRFKSIFDVSKNVERVYIWKSSIDMIMDHPLTGVGFNNYTEAIKGYRGNYSHTFSPGSDAHAHNNILTQTAELGIIGLTAFLWIWIRFFKEGVKMYLNPPNPSKGGEGGFQKAIIIGGLGAIFGFHIAGMFEGNFGDAEVATMVWFTMGLVFLINKKEEG
jgi:O-antigen ligase